MLTSNSTSGFHDTTVCWMASKLPGSFLSVFLPLLLLYFISDAGVCQRSLLGLPSLSPPSDLIRFLSIKHHPHADESQTYISFSLEFHAVASNCLPHSSTFMSRERLKHNILEKKLLFPPSTFLP